MTQMDDRKETEMKQDPSVPHAVPSSPSFLWACGRVWPYNGEADVNFAAAFIGNGIFYSFFINSQLW